MKRLLTVIVMAVALVGVSVVGSVAGVKMIRPDELRPYESDCVYTMTPTFMRCNSDTLVAFYAVVKLPVGKVVKKLILYYSSNPADGEMDVFLNRHSMEASGPTQMAHATASGHSSKIPVENLNPINYAKIKRGYTYYVTVSMENGANFQGIKITYK